MAGNMVRNLYGIDINHPVPLQGYRNEMVFFPGALPLAIILRTIGTNGNVLRAFPVCTGAGSMVLHGLLWDSLPLSIHEML
jgi:hypothetical protein